MVRGVDAVPHTIEFQAAYRHPFVGAVIDRPQKCVDFQSNSRYMAPFRRKIANIDTFPCRALNERPYTLKETVFFYRWKLPYQESGLVRNDPEFDTAKRHPILYLISYILYLIFHSSFLIPVKGFGLQFFPFSSAVFYTVFIGWKRKKSL